MFKKIVVLASLLAFMCANAYGGTVAITKRHTTTMGDKRVVTGLITLTGAYSGTAFSLTPRVVGLTVVDEISFVPASVAASTYTPVMNSNYMQFTRPKYNTLKPSVTAPAGSDTLRIYGNQLTAVDADTCNLFISPLSGQWARLVAPGITPTSAGVLTQNFTYADSSTYAGFVADSVLGGVKLRGVYMGGETLFYDYNATNRLAKFMYSGANIGDLGTLYVPMGGGHFLPVVKRARGGSTTSIATVGAYPMYFLRSAGLDDKLLCNVPGTATPTTGAMVDTTYTSLVQYVPTQEDIQDGVNMTGIAFYFIAVGN